jgi:catechol 2,3-dioxygenase-like lactoylglutathione lyase family enzyme
MFDHITFGVSDYAASKAFFLKALEPLGIAIVSERPHGVELSSDGNSSLCICQTEQKPAHLHLALTAKNRRQVEAFPRAALEAGGKDNGALGLRAHYHVFHAILTDCCRNIVLLLVVARIPIQRDNH